MFLLSLVALAGCAGTRQPATDASLPSSRAAASPAPVVSVPRRTASPVSTPSATVAAPDLDAATLRAEPVIELAAPTALAVRSGDDALYIAERGGRIVRVVDGVAENRSVLDISSRTTDDGERGLLGLAFSPDGTELYVSSTDVAGDSRLEAYTMDGGTADTATRRQLLSVPQPFSNHNGGHVVTGPDGLLYYGLGDGGGGGDPQGNGQDPSTLLGTLLRIDPLGGRPYAVPDDNPYVGTDEGRPEVWVTGLRNPWRFSFDRRTDDLWIGDVGQNAIEEIDRLPFAAAGGANLGWNVFEGTERFGDGSASGAVAPVLDYAHDSRCSVTGGHVYRGSAIPGLAGAYVYGDFCDGVVRALVVDDDRVTGERAFDVQIPELVSFAEDHDGELYALSLQGTVSRLVATR